MLHIYTYHALAKRSQSRDSQPSANTDPEGGQAHSREAGRLRAYSGMMLSSSKLNITPRGPPARPMAESPFPGAAAKRRRCQRVPGRVRAGGGCCAERAVAGGLLVLLVVGAGGATFDPVPGPSGARSGSAIEIFEIWAGLALSSLLCARLSAAQRKCSAARRILFSRKLARTKLNLSHAHSRACSCAARPDEAAWEATGASPWPPKVLGRYLGRRRQVPSVARRPPAGGPRPLPLPLPLPLPQSVPRATGTQSMP